MSLLMPINENNQRVQVDAYGYPIEDRNEVYTIDCIIAAWMAFFPV